ncbi:MAG: N-acetylmuramoyl-L-alanine amidase [Saprospiraceae bacterium]|jgi:N-acetylmuramoyl-L-alanine amidase|nr:N-acetylmuramoyl-L-alanine amidase [Saprospiraceae bacterium]
MRHHLSDNQRLPQPIPVCLYLVAVLFLFVPAGLVAQKKTTVRPAASRQAKPAKPTKPEPVYLVVEAKPGESVPTLLARFGLDGYECNVSEFFRINGLKEDYRLKAGASYKIPVQVVLYDGKTIRSTLGIDDWQTATRISDFNKDCKTKGYRSRDFIDDKELWVPWHELNCREEVALVQAVREAEVVRANTAVQLKEPTAGAGSRVFPIFGKKYQKTPLASSKLKGKVFYVISGHGGPDGGAEGRRAGHNLCEDEYAYDVALRLVRLLISHDATAYMIVRDDNDGIRDDAFLKCDKDETVWGDLAIPIDQKERLGQRTTLINELTEIHNKANVKDQMIIEIHVDSRLRHKEIDVFFYYRPDSDPSKEMAEKLHKTFLQKYARVRSQKRYNGSVTPRALYTLRETTAPVAVYVELGNIRNDWDQQRLVIPSNRQALANWLFEALK